MYVTILAAALLAGAAAWVTALARHPARELEDRPMQPPEPEDYERILREGGTVRIPFGEPNMYLVVSIADCYLERTLQMPLSSEQEWGLLLASSHPGRLTLSWENDPEGNLVPKDMGGLPVYEPAESGHEEDGDGEHACNHDHDSIRSVLSTRRRLLTPAPEEEKQ